MSQLKIIPRNPKDLIAAEYNPRSLSEEQFSTIKDSLKRFGFVDPVIVNKHPDRNDIIIGGHQRVKVAKSLDFEEVPTVELSLTIEQEKELNIRLNKNTGSFDNEALSEFFEEDDLIEWGFSPEELDFFEPEEDEPEVEEDDFDEEPPEEPKTELGRIYQLGNHRLMCGDSTSEADVKRLMNGELADMWLTDPPYNVDYEGKTEDSLKIENDSMADGEFRTFLTNAYQAANTALKAGASFYIWHADSEGYNFRGAAKDVGWQVRQCLIWMKNAIVLGRQDYHWQHEPCLYGWTKGTHKWYADRKQSTILKFNKPNRNGEHPTMKPVELFGYLIQNNSREEDIILDSFGGSGTTLIASQQLNRRAFLMEFDPRYCDVIVKRYCKLKGIDPEEVFETGVAK